MQRGDSVKRLIWLLSIAELCVLSGAQLPMPANYLPKEYFLPDGTRDPRHLTSHLESSVNSFYPPGVSGSGNPSSPSNAHPGVTTTYHLNPRSDLQANFNLNTNDHNNNLNLNSYASNYGSNFNNNNNHLNNLNNNNNPSQYGDKIITSSSTTNSRRSRRRLKLRRLPKSFRPPKEFIIYSLPEQSFWSTHEDDPLTSGGTSDLDDLEDNRTDNEDDDDEGNNAQSKNETDSKDKDISSTTKTSGEEINNNNIDGALLASSVSQKKVLLGQCMKHCIDALL